ncbi:hypothetical protein AL01_01190 [Bombella intestini]|uniref:Uncharacterized protein n=1 Tax=Bombella intestini TaxID=1539051 RepID=A0A1S8GRL9_9PROT|nr:hypothetical protein [Bombella intestini]OOL19625.1 hypothetical protein AL01_01190 [Bombella intestini]
MKLQQTSVIAGKPSTVTLVVKDENGNIINDNFDAPPGPSVTLPDNLVTTADLAQMVAGTLQLGANDLRAVGVKWAGAIGAPRLDYGGTGGTDPSLYSHLLGTNQKGNYLCANGNSVAQIVGEAGPLMIQRFSIAGQNPATVSFPVPFAGDNVLVFISTYAETINGTPHFRCVELLEPATRYGCRLSCYDLIARNWENVNFRIDLLAIGPAPSTV